MSTPTMAPQRPPATREATDVRPRGGRIVLGALLLVGGLGWLLDVLGVAQLRWGLLLPAAVIVVGLTLVVTAWRGSQGGLVAVGIVLSVLVVVTSAVPAVTPFAGVGDRTERPVGVAELADDFELSVGKLTVDARQLDLAALDGRPARLTASVGMGELVVRVPAGVGLDVAATSGMGEVVVLGQSRAGFGPSVEEFVGGTPGAGHVILDVSVGMGRVEVVR